MIYLQIALILGYFVFTMWLVFATYINFVLKPWKNAKYSVSSGVVWFYVITWSLVFTSPIAYSMILEAVGS